MEKCHIGFASMGFALVALPPAQAEGPQQKVAVPKAAAAESQQRLRSYAWIEKTELSLKSGSRSPGITSSRHGTGSCPSARAVAVV